MNIMSWNVNGLRAIAKKGFDKFLVEYNPDVLCIQETKAQFDNLKEEHTAIEDYYSYFFSAQRKGYSGVAIYTKHKPLSVLEGMDVEEFDDEGRVLTAEFNDFFVISVYVPNAQPQLKRIVYREKFNDKLLRFANNLKNTYQKDIFICGDFNVAHNEIDLKNPKANRGNPGFSDEERTKFNEVLNAGYVDTFRYFYPETIKYSWWSYRFNARSKGIGWRIDYILCNKEAISKIKEVAIHDEVLGSDHCPVSITLK
ncbi:MAG: exodeoxyribonuclease III [Candidatus Nanoarchaeia archaeon]